MKLHLPKLLRNAVLACITAVAGVSTTVGTAAFTGGVVAFALAQQAQAANDLNVPVGGSFYGGSYEFDFILRSGSIADGETKVLAYYGGSSITSDAYGANAYVLSRTGDAITLKVGRGKLSSTDIGGASMTYQTADTYTFETLLTMGESYTLKITGGNQSQVVALWQNGTEIEVGTAYAGNMNGSANAMTSAMNRAFLDLKHVISGSVNEGINLDAYANDYQLIFALEGNGSKYFATNNVKVVNSDVQIGETDGDGTKGLIITNGNSSNHQIFTGKLTGNGLIKRTGGGSTLISFTGNTSEFSGNIELGPGQGHNFTLTFGSVTAGGNTYAATAGASTAESGIIGNGNIVLLTSRATLVFNYGRTDAPVYITNTFSIPTLAEGNVEMHGNLELRGGADYILTKALDVKGKLTIDAPVTVQSGLTISGTLNLASTDYLLPTGEGSFQTREANGQMVASTTGNGFYTGDVLVIEAGEGTSVALGANAAFQLKGTANSNFSVKDGNLVYTGSIPGVYYAMNEQAQATNAIAGASGFTKYHVVKDGVLSVAVGDTLNANNARNVITNTTGEGKISIQSGTSVDFNGINTITSAFRGDIIVNEGANLYLGTDNDSNNDGEKATRVVNLAGGVTLDGGMLRFQGKTLNVQRLTSTNDTSVLRITDMHGDDRMAYFAEVDLQNNLTVQAKHKYTLKFGCLTGAGDLAISSKENVPFTIDSVRDYSGNIAVGNGVQ
ncbi:MAG: hypothetical protein IKT79_02915, partial [Akkermansia sp.]|nr:hypothetical protein [Akkermansia sp.]